MIDALFRLGGMLKAGPKATGGKPYQATGFEVEPVDRAPTLADLGISKKVSMIAQQLAAAAQAGEGLAAAGARR